MSEEEQLAQIIGLHKSSRKELVSLLLEVQRALGYLPEAALKTIADYLQVPPSVVYGVATFYNEFRFTPIGKHHIKVCMGTACHLQGGELVLDAAKRELDIEVGGVTLDREFSLDRVACVGCCSLAPVVVVSDVVHPRMNNAKVEEIVALINQGRQGESGDSGI